MSTQVKTGLGDFSRDLRAADLALKNLARATRSGADTVRRFHDAIKAEPPKPAGDKGASGGSGSKGDLKSAAGDAAQTGGQIAAALQLGFAPLNSLGARLVAQFEVVGGTVVTLARRIDGAMKAPAIDAFIEKLRKSDNAFIRLGGDVANVGNKIHSFFANFGDVAGKSLSQVTRLGKARFDGTAAEAGKLGRAFGAVTAPVKTLTGSVRTLGTEIAIAFGAFGLAYKAIGFLKDGVKAASDLNESVSASKQVFGDSFGAIGKQADEMTKKFGLSKRAQIDIATAFGSIAQGAKYSERESAAFANTFAKLTADFQSLKNIPTLEEAGQKIQAALAGEAEPLRRFGVLIDEAAVKQEAMRLGLARGAKDLDQHSKMVARASLIEKGLSAANGDLERTGGDAANTFRKAGGGVQNFGAMIGAVLLPAVKSGVEAFNELLASTIEVFEANKPLIESWANALSTAMGYVGVVVRNFGALWQVLELRVGAFVSNAIAWVETLPGNFGIITDYVGRNWQALLFDLVNATSLFYSNMLKNAANFGMALWDAIQGKGFTFEFTPLMEGFKATAEKLPDLIKPALMDIEPAVAEILKGVTDKEAARALAIANGKANQAGAKPKPGEQDNSPAGAKFAETAERGSKEAYTAIIKAQAAGNRDKPIREVAKTAKEQLAELKKLNGAQGKGKPTKVFKMV